MGVGTQAASLRVDHSRYELTLNGQRVKLERQPMELLIFFVRRRGELVTREDIIDKLWGKDVFVDVDRGINSAVRKIRNALKDDSAHPQYLETVVGKGYKFVGDVELVGIDAVEHDQQIPPVERISQAPKYARNVLAAGMFLVIAVIGWFGFEWRQKVASGPKIHTIVVLPLANLSGDRSQDYFADGITDELTTDLARISSLRVISRTTATQYRNTQEPLSQIARELKLDAVVEGSVTRSGNNVRITAQLIDAATDQHLWAESFDRDLGDMLKVQNLVALEIAHHVRSELTSAEQKSMAQERSLNAAAYDLYLQGRYAQTKQLPEELKSSLSAFQQSIDLDPTFAPAYAGLADSYSLLANYGVLSPKAAFPAAEAAAQRSLELDETLAEAHNALGFAKNHFDWDWSGAEREFQRAIALSPSYGNAHYRYAELLSNEGRHEEAIREIFRARELDPLSMVIWSNVGRILYHARRYDQAIEELHKLLKFDPDRVYAQIHLALCYEGKSMYPEAIAEFEKIDAAMGEPTIGHAHVLAASGRVNDARKMLSILEQKYPTQNWFFRAAVYGALGQKDQAFQYLNRGYEDHDFFLSFAKVSPYMDPLRTDARFPSLLRSIGLQ